MSLLSCLAQSQVFDFNESWRWSSFTTSSGLPSNRIDCYYESPNGLVLVGTPNGISSFDGYQWSGVILESDPPGFRPNQIIGFAEDSVAVRMGTQVFIGINNSFRRIYWDPIQKIQSYNKSSLLLFSNSHLWKYSKGIITPIKTNAGSDERNIHDAWCTSDEDVWVAYSDGLYSLKHGWVFRSTETLDEIRIQSIFEINRDTIAFTVGSPASLRGFWEMSKSTLHKNRIDGCADLVKSVATNGFDISIAVTATGDALIRGHKGWRYLIPAPFQLKNAEFVAFRRHGELVVGSNAGLHMFDGLTTNWSINQVKDITLSNRVQEILVSSDKRILVATVTGLRIIDYMHVMPDIHIGAIGNIDLDVITGLAEDDGGNIWISSGSGFDGAFKWDKNTWTHHSAVYKGNKVHFHKIKKDSEGNLWFLGIANNYSSRNRHEPGIFKFDGRVLVRLDYSTELKNGRLYAFDKGADGTMWFGTDKGLFRLKNSIWEQFSTTNGLLSNRVYTLAIDSSQTTWFSDQYSGLGSIDSFGNIRYYRTPDGLLSNYISDIRVDSSNTVWFATRSGLGSLNNGRFMKLDWRSGLDLPELSTVLPLNNEIIVGSLGGGIARMQRQKLERKVPRIQLEKPSAEESSVVLRWKSFAYWGEIAPHEILTRYRINEGDWSTWELRNDILISGLSPGSYTYQVQAQGVFGQYDEDGVTSTFTIALPYYRQSSFFVAVFAIFSITVGVVLILNKRRQNIAMTKTDSGARFSTIADATNSAILLYDRREIIYANQKAESLIGCAAGELESRSFYSLFPPEDRRRILEYEAADPPPPPIECRLLSRSNEERWVDIATSDITFHGRTVKMGTLNDISPRIRAEVALREEEEQFQSIIARAPVGILLINNAGNCQNVNAMWCRMSGQSHNEALGTGWTAAIHPEDREETLESWNRASRTSIPFTAEFRLVSLHGLPPWVAGASIPVQLGGDTGSSSLMIITDISDRKQAERMLSEYRDTVKSLTEELTSTEERERRQMAVYLHDCVGQSLAFCRLKLQEIQDSQAMKHDGKSLDELRTLIEQSIRDTRSLTFELNPPVLQELGLHQAVEILTDHLNSIGQTRFSITTPPFHDTLTKEQQAIFYQAARELMRNVLKHARATHASVSMEFKSTTFLLTVADDGIGFNQGILASGNGTKTGFGLRSLLDRMSYIGGSLSISSEPGQGSRITASLPL